MELGGWSQVGGIRWVELGGWSQVGGIRWVDGLCAQTGNFNFNISKCTQTHTHNVRNRRYWIQYWISQAQLHTAVCIGEYVTLNPIRSRHY